MANLVPNPACWRSKSLAGMLLLTAVCLIPFADKAIHIDDPLFIWTARQIQKHPLDPYGFSINWYGTTQPMPQVVSNPPLVPAYAALIATLFGWSEVALHLGFLMPALLAVGGLWCLARRLSESAELATLSMVFTPVFFVTATTLMCDMPMLAFGLWGLIFWERGLREQRSRFLALGCCLSGLAILCKFNGGIFWPLMAVRGFLVRRRPGAWLFPLLLPLFLLGGFEVWTASRYGQGLFSATSAYAASVRAEVQGTSIDGLLFGLVFTGGCLLPVVFFVPLLLSWRVWTIGVGLGLLVITALPGSGVGGLSWLDSVQFVLLALAGMAVLFLAVSEFARGRDSISTFLLLWTMGIFIYASLVNWTVNARGFLPMAPAVGLLLARRWARRQSVGLVCARVPWVWPMVAGAMVTILVAMADYRLADSARIAANRFSRTLRNFTGATLWFQGHWGFQYYMQQLGASALDFRASKVSKGDLLIVPSNNSNLYPGMLQQSQFLDAITLVPNRWLTTMQTDRVGFYAHLYGPLPFAFGPVAPEEYRLYEIRNPFIFRPEVRSE